MKKLLKHIALLIAVFIPYWVNACSMCGGAVTPEKKSAYEGTTVFLAIMPLLVTGLIFGYVIRKYRTRS